MTIGRNDLCPCGSGKKYKKCCALQSSEPLDLKQWGKFIQSSQNQSLLTSPWYQTQWDNHRQKVTQLIVSAPGRNELLLIGPGNCNDFDLNKIANEFNHIDLLDIDPISVTAAIKKLPPEEQAKFTVVEFDVTGIYDQVVPSLVENLPSFSAEQLEKHLSLIERQIEPIPLPPEIAGKSYDSVGILAVFSQLFMPFYETKILPQFSGDNKRLRALGIKLSDRLSELAFETVLPILKKGTQFSFYSDILQFSNLTPDLIRQLSSIDMALGSQFMNRRIVGADGVIRYVEKFNPMAKYGHLDTWIWEFDQQRKYYTLGITFTNPG